MIRANMASAQTTPTLVGSVAPGSGSTATNVTANVDAGTYLIQTAVYGATTFTSIAVTLDGNAVTPSVLVAPSSGNTIGAWYVDIPSSGSLSVTINLPDGFSGLTVTAV